MSVVHILFSVEIFHMLMTGEVRRVIVDESMLNEKGKIVLERLQIIAYSEKDILRLMMDEKTPMTPAESLRLIVTEYPNIWDNPDQMRSLLSECLPKEKLYRNLILTCAEEKIPNQLIKAQSCSRIDLHRYAQLVVDAHECSYDRAKEVVMLWIDALHIDKKEIIIEYPGHEMCAQLRKIRQKIAELNDIEFEPTECTHEGPCDGTCPACDAEIRYLDEKLQRKEERGEEIIIKGIAWRDIQRSQLVVPVKRDFLQMGRLRKPHRNLQKRIRDFL